MAGVHGYDNCFYVHTLQTSGILQNWMSLILWPNFTKYNPDLCLSTVKIQIINRSNDAPLGRTSP